MKKEESVEEYLNSVESLFKEDQFEISELSEDDILSYQQSLSTFTETKPTMYSWGGMKMKIGKEEHSEDY